MLRGHVLLPGQHLVRIAPNGVDLAVVDHKAVGMGTLPAGVGIGGEAGMHHGDGRHKVRALEICVKGAQLPYQKHALVHNGPAGKGYYIGIFGRLLEQSPGDVKLSVELQPFFQVSGLLYKALHNPGHALHCLLSQDVRKGGHFPPAQKLQPLFLNDDLEHFLGLVPAQFLLWEEDHGNAVLSLSSQVHPQNFHHSGEKRMGNLGEDAHAVPGLALRVLSCPVL